MSEKYNFNFEKNDYLTPPELIKKLLKEIGTDKFDLDVCCSKDNIPALHHIYNGINDGLLCDWQKLNWLNPPFDTCDKWIKKAWQEQQKGNTTYSILPARTETKYWHDYILDKPNVEVRFLRKGLCFYDPQTDKPVQMKVTNPKTGEKKSVDGVFKNPLAIVIWHGIKGDAQISLGVV